MLLYCRGASTGGYCRGNYLAVVTYIIFKVHLGQDTQSFMLMLANALILTYKKMPWTSIVMVILYISKHKRIDMSNLQDTVIVKGFRYIECIINMSYMLTIPYSIGEFHRRIYVSSFHIPVSCCIRLEH